MQKLSCVKYHTTRDVRPFTGWQSLVDEDKRTNAERSVMFLKIIKSYKK